MNATVTSVRIICPVCGQAQDVPPHLSRFVCVKCAAPVSAGGVVDVVITRFKPTWGDVLDVMFKVAVLAIPLAIMLAALYAVVGVSVLRLIIGATQ